MLVNWRTRQFYYFWRWCLWPFEIWCVVVVSSQFIFIQVVRAYMLMEVRYYCVIEVQYEKGTRRKSLCGPFFHSAVICRTWPLIGRGWGTWRGSAWKKGGSGVSFLLCTAPWMGGQSWLRLVSSPRCQGTGPEEMASSCAKWGSGWILGKKLARHWNRLPRKW